MTRGTHYSLATDIPDLLRWSKAAAAEVLAILNGEPFVLAYRGISGIAHGTALALALEAAPRSETDGQLKFGVAIVRKDGENSHSERKIEVDISRIIGETVRVVFVDDFIGRGDTRHEVLTAVRNHFAENCSSVILKGRFISAMARKSGGFGASITCEPDVVWTDDPAADAIAAERIAAKKKEAGHCPSQTREKVSHDTERL